MNTENQRVPIVYKITTESDWAQACKAGAYAGSADDARDGFIHFSAAHQVAATAVKYFSGRAGLVLVAFEAADLGPALKWEASRGGDLFPHLYAELCTAHALWVKPLPLEADGTPQLPGDLR